MKHSIVVATIAGVALLLGAYLSPGRVQAADDARINGFTLVAPNPTFLTLAESTPTILLPVPMSQTRLAGLLPVLRLRGRWLASTD
jgi:hypothetical protein